MGIKFKVIHPPVEIKDLILNKIEKIFIYVLMISSNKRIDLLIKAFNKLGLPLFIVGTGSEGQIKENGKIKYKIFWEKIQ